MMQPLRKRLICEQTENPYFLNNQENSYAKKKTGPTRASDLMKKVSVIGQKFWTYITSDEDHQNFPMFIKKGEYNHGVA